MDGVGGDTALRGKPLRGIFATSPPVSPSPDEVSQERGKI
jgi:hypothetical protein